MHSYLQTHPSSLLRALGVIRLHLDLDAHVILPEPRDADSRPDGRVVRAPGAEVARHDLDDLAVERQVVRVDTEHLRPSLAARRLQGEVDVLEGLVDLCLDVPWAGL